MSKKHKNYSAAIASVELARDVNLAPGIAVLLLSVVMTILGFSVEMSVFPFGGIAACIFCALQMVQRRSVAPGYASFFVVMPAIGAALATMSGL